MGTEVLKLQLPKSGTNFPWMLDYLQLLPVLNLGLKPTFLFML